MSPATGALWLGACATPVIFAVALMLAGLLPQRVAAAARAAIVRLAPAAALPAIALAVLAPAPARVDWLLLGTHLAVDEFAQPLVLVAALLYALALGAICWNRERGSAVLVGFLLLSFAGNIGTYLAADVVTFYLAFAVMSFCAFGLVIHYRTDEARRAGRIYLIMSVASETAILAALILITAGMGQNPAMVEAVPSAVASSPQRDVIITLLLLGFGVKAGTVPLHIWLPLAHPAAPPAASAVLSGAMVKAGMLGMIRFLPLGQVALPTWGTLLVVLALVGAFLAIPIGALQADPKVVLAYSTISQMGFIVAVLGVGLADPGLARMAALAVVVYAVGHGLVKGTLFLGVSVCKHHRSAPVAVLMAFAAFALAGAPLTAGALGKYAAKGAVGDITFIGAPLDVVLSLVATGSTLLMLRLARLLWRGEPEPNAGERGELCSWVVLALCAASVPWVVVFGWIPQVAVPSANPLTWWDSVWPIGLGILVGIVAWWMSRQHVLPDWAAHPDGTAIPPGDLVVPEETQLARAGAGLRAGFERAHELGRALGSEVGSASRALGEFVVANTVAREERLTQERSSGVALLVVLSIVLILVALIQEGLS